MFGKNKTISVQLAIMITQYIQLLNLLKTERYCCGGSAGSQEVDFMVLNVLSE